MGDHRARIAAPRGRPVAPERRPTARRDELPATRKLVDLSLANHATAPNGASIAPNLTPARQPAVLGRMAPAPVTRSPMRIERLGVTSATSAIGAAPNDDPDRAVPDARLVLPLERARATIVHPAATTRTALRATIVHPVATRRTARRATVASRNRRRRVPDPMVDGTAHRSCLLYTSRCV